MKISTFCLLIIFFVSGIFNRVSAQKTYSIDEIRSELFYSDFDYEKCLEFYEMIVSAKNNSAIFIAYQAVAEALLAQHSWNPISKIRYINNASSLLKKAVDLDKSDLEIRFLRLYIENKTPSYLGMKSNVKEDKEMLMSNLTVLKSSKYSADISNYIISYLNSTEVTGKEQVRAKPKAD